MKKVVAFLFRSFNRKFSKKSTSNKHFYTSSSARKYDARDKYELREKPEYRKYDKGGNSNFRKTDAR